MSDATLTLSPPENAVTPETNPFDGHNPMMLISMRNIWKTYQMGTESVHALHGVSFDIPRVEYIAIIGPSGSGKSTLLGLLAGLDTPTSGTVKLDGIDIFALNEDGRAELRKTRLGFVFQSFQLLAHLNALENVVAALKTPIRGRNGDSIQTSRPHFVCSRCAARCDDSSSDSF